MKYVVKCILILQIVISINADNTMGQVIDTGDKVGIGVNPPLEKLHINGAIRGNSSGGALRINTPTGYLDIGSMNESWAHFQTDRPRFYFEKPITINGAISSYNSNDLFLQTNGSNRITVLNSNGNVGIGIDIPQDKLHLNGNMRIPFVWALTDANYNRPVIKTGWITNIGDFMTLKHGGNNTESGTFGLRISDGYGLEFGYNDFASTYLKVTTAGKVGIGTTTPETTLHLKEGNQSIKFLSGTNTSGYALAVGVNDDGVNFSNNSTSRGFNFSNASGSLVRIGSTGNVGIGTTNPNQKLTVNGTIYGKEVKVDLNVPGPDYVFEPTYQLPSLTEIENYIKANKHLPEVPSAKEMETNGINLSEMNMLLLKKVEELTLYIIELKKENEKQNQLILEIINKK